MTVILEKHRLAYVAVPKAACTSIKSMFFEIENGFTFNQFTSNGRKWHIHRIYPSVPFGKLPHNTLGDHSRLSLVRDPVRRLLSCYSNRILHHRELSRAKAGKVLRQADLAPDPDIATFIGNLDAYRAAVRSIDHHARPMVDFLGTDPDYFTRVYRFEELGDFAEDVRRLTGTQVELGRKQTGGPKIDPDTLSAKQVAFLKEYYAADYAAFGAYL